MQLHRNVSLLAVLLTLTVTACTTTTKPPSENTSGVYTPSGSQWYQTRSGVLYAWDGTAWYSLRSAENNAGYIGGVNVGGPECWVRVGEGSTRCYARTPATFRDPTLKPVFIAY